MAKPAKPLKLEDLKAAFDAKSIYCETLDKTYEPAEHESYQTGVHRDKVAARSFRVATAEQYKEIDEFVEANGLGAKDYKIYQGLSYGLTLEECVEMWLDGQKPFHPLITKHRKRKVGIK